MPYRLEYAKSNRSSCKAKCENPKIEKGEIRFGSVSDRDGHEMVYWKHLNCITKKQAMGIDSVEEVEGFSGLNAEDQKKVEELISAKKNEEPPKKKRKTKAKTKDKPKEVSHED